MIYLLDADASILTGVHGQPRGLLQKAHLDTHEGVLFSPSVSDALAAAAKHITPGKTPLAA